jgi:hypothetical protein
MVNTLSTASLIAVRIAECRITWRLHVDVNCLRLRLRLVWVNNWLRLTRCVGLHIHDLGSPIPNFAVPEFDNPAVLENNFEV